MAVQKPTETDHRGPEASDGDREHNALIPNLVAPAAPRGRKPPTILPQATAASAEYERESDQRDVLKGHRDAAGRTTQTEGNSWRKLLGAEAASRLRASDATARREQDAARPPRRAAAPRNQPREPRPPAPNLDDHNLNLFTVLPPNLSAALGTKLLDTIASHGGIAAVLSLPGCLTDAFSEILSVPKTCLKKERGKSGAEQRKAVLRNLGANPPETDSPDEPPRLEKSADQSACARALRFFSLGFLSRAAKALDVEETPRLADDDVFEKLVSLHPAAVLGMPRCFLSPGHTFVDKEILRLVVLGMASGSAAGPDGWTEDMLAPLLSDPDLARFFTAVIQSIIDGTAPCDRDRLVVGRLVGITKPDGGIRPIAVGTIWVKIASRYLIKVHQDNILAYFFGVQFGCGEENGAEAVAHNARRAYQNKETLCTIDCRNAFNSPCRAALWAAVSRLACMLPFLGIFVLEYQEPSDLIFHGRSCTRKIRSERGTRQGSVFGGLFFSALIHPVLLACLAKFPTVKLWAYLDDITLACADENELAAAFLFLKCELARLRLDFNPAKCEILLREGALLPDSLIGEVCVKNGFIKVLGCFIGNDSDCAEQLVHKQNKHNHFFRRIVSLAGPASYAVLSACGVPRATYFVRTHSPQVSSDFVAAFEKQLIGAATVITNARFDEETRLHAHFPRREGGLGLTLFPLIAPLAYTASLGQCLPDSFPEPVNSQKVATAILNKELKLKLGGLHRETMKETSVKGTSAWLVENAFWINSHFAAALRYRLAAAAADDPLNLECAPCNAIFSAEDHPTHVAGCVRRSGKNATRKHNRLRDISHHRLRSVAVVCETEPRDYKAFLCNKCHKLFTKDDSIVHARTCRTATFRPTGPDLRVEWGASSENAADQDSIVYDWTVVHATAPSHRGCDLKKLFADKTAEKNKMYKEMVEKNGEKFVVLCVSSHGVMSPETLTFVSRLAGATGEKDLKTRAALMIALQQYNGGAIAQSRGRRWDQ